MANSNEFIDFLYEVFEDLGPIQAKRMFGGYGVYHDGLMFGLVVAPEFDTSTPFFRHFPGWGLYKSSI